MDFIPILDSEKVPDNFIHELQLTFDICEQEFIDRISVGRHYRRECFDEVKAIILTSLGKMGAERFSRLLLNMHPLLRHLNQGLEIINGLAISQNSIQEAEAKGYLYCFAYLVVVEGVFDDLMRILYSIHQNGEGHVLAYQDVKEMGLKEIRRNLEQNGLHLIALDNWEEKNHIRNSIGHARFRYDRSKNVFHFQDYNVRTEESTYDEHKTFRDFAKLALEMEDTLQAFQHIFMLIRVRDIVSSQDAYVK